MITRSDVLSFRVTPEELRYCQEHPDPDCFTASTGQLRTLGNIALAKALSIPWPRFEQQLDRARQLGASFAFEVQNGRIEGICPTVSVIRDAEVLRKHIVVPASQLRRSGKLQAKHTVAVFVIGDTNAEKEPVSVDSVEVAGWVTAAELVRRWMGKEDGAPFHVRNSAVAPCVILSPMQVLLGQVNWTKYEV